MFSSTTRRSIAALPLLLGAVALLAGCTAAATDQPDAAANDALAAKFVACLEDEGQTAKIIDGGMVGLLLPDGVENDGGMMTSPGGPGDSQDGGDGPSAPVMVMMDEDGQQWQTSTEAAGFPEEGGMRDAWTACEEEIPDFEQPEPDMSGATSVTKDEVIEVGLAFAACARDEGYADFADPDLNGMMSIPTYFTEDEFRSLLEACFDSEKGTGFGISKENADHLDFDLMAVMQEFMGPVGPGSGTGNVESGSH
ncbi:MAG: hypothetical protein JWN36_2103 [Microbacteriaceae bacterium]|nr:hypothetical protein [Microbacteriaceae bacterium]